MTFPVSNSYEAADNSDVQAARECLQRLIQEGQTLPTETVLSTYPQLAEDRDVQLELIYLEFVLRQETEQPISEAELCSRFPELAQDIRMLMEVDAAVHWSPSHATTVEPPLHRAVMDTPASFPGRAAEEARNQIRQGALPTDAGFDDYHILEKIGQGGMGLVYRASSIH